MILKLIASLFTVANLRFSTQLIILNYPVKLFVVFFTNVPPQGFNNLFMTAFQKCTFVNNNNL